MTKKKKFIVVGRAGVDLYAEQLGVDLKEVTSFKRYVGGSAANIAVQVGRLSGGCHLLTKLTGDPWGKYIKKYLSSCGVEIPIANHMLVDSSRNSLAVTEIKKESQVMFYRHNPSDIHISPLDIKESTVASAAGVIITGTSLSGSPSREAVLLILFFAHRNSVPVILDLDYRPTGFKNDGEIFVYYQAVMEKSDILIGTEEEFRRALAFLKTKSSLIFKNEQELADFLLQGKTKLVIVKKGSRGSVAYQRERNGKIKKSIGGTFKVKVAKNFGAGDAFAGTFCHYYLGSSSQGLDDSIKRASASAAIVVSRKTCTEAMPTEKELLEFIECNRYQAKTK